MFHFLEVTAVITLVKEDIIPIQPSKIKTMQGLKRVSEDLTEARTTEAISKGITQT